MTYKWSALAEIKGSGLRKVFCETEDNNFFDAQNILEQLYGRVQNLTRIDDISFRRSDSNFMENWVKDPGFSLINGILSVITWVMIAFFAFVIFQAFHY